MARHAEVDQETHDATGCKHRLRSGHASKLIATMAQFIPLIVLIGVLNVFHATMVLQFHRSLTVGIITAR